MMRQVVCRDTLPAPTDIPRGSSSFPLFPLEFRMFVLVEEGKPEDPEKNSRSNDKNQQQTQPTCLISL